jgi:hypothetical protein
VFFTYLLLMFSVSLCMSALFRFVGAIAATQVGCGVCVVVRGWVAYGQRGGQSACPNCAAPLKQTPLLLLLLPVTADISSVVGAGAATGSQVHAQGYASVVILVLVITSGFAIVRSEWPRPAAPVMYTW